ncbi:MAG: hypothetical protein LBQ31_07905 [Bacteroidales bacterium]|nr:hypothetical protein [Bacteroidales bacterium]
MSGAPLGFGLRASGFGLRASGFGLRASGFGLRASGFGLRASGLIWYEPRRSCVLRHVEIQENFTGISTANSSWCDFINSIVYAKHKRWSFLCWCHLKNLKKYE